MEGDPPEVDMAQLISKPFEKYLPSATVTRAEPVVDWDLTSERAERMEEMKVGFRRCSPSPVRVRKKTSPRFSKVHMMWILVVMALEFAVCKKCSYFCLTTVL